MGDPFVTLYHVFFHPTCGLITSTFS